MADTFLAPTQAQGVMLFSRNIPGQVIMLNLLRFRDVADYTGSPELAPENATSGREAYQKYIDHTLPFLQATGGEVMLMADGGEYFIGPTDERWDMVLLIRQNSVQDFLDFASNEDYQTGMGHRTAALEDSRLLPLVEVNENSLTTKG